MSINITLPDNSVRSFEGPITGAMLAADIGPGLAKSALAIKVDGAIKDLATPIERDAAVSIITKKDQDGIELLRHDAAHIMAEAVQGLFPGTQVTIGPVIEHGFYYDFHRETPFTPDDLAAIEQRMQEIVARNAPFTREVWSRADATKLFEDKGETFKVELIRDLPGDEELSIYRQGEWFDLCRGPHAPSTGHLGKAFKLTVVSGAYWRADQTKAQLQRIYGIAFRDEKELQAHLTQLEEAAKRDHRKLGRELDLFHLQEEAAGSVFWHPHGWTLYRTLENFIRRRIAGAGYVEVKTPQLFDTSLFKASGHLDMYGDNMYKLNSEPEGKEPKWMALKPMNCPAHVQIFKQGITSYRDLPIRMAEFGSCLRNEPSGALHGIMRVRGFVQDDAHIFCTPGQVAQESLDYFKLQLGVYRDLGFADENIKVKLALRPEPRLGDDATWDRAEEDLRQALRNAGLEFEELPGEGAFYGPKVEFHLIDAIGRTWQCGTLQLDFQLPERLGAEYVGEDGAKHRPVVLHRAILGSMERFIAILIEHHAGKFPLWLAPLQVVIATITNDADGYANEVLAACRKAGLRAELDTRAEKIGYKIREHSVKKVPLLFVVGKNEAASRQVAVRTFGGEDQTLLSLDAAIVQFVKEAAAPQQNADESN